MINHTSIAQIKTSLVGAWDMLNDNLKICCETGLGIDTEVKFNESLPVTICLNIQATGSRNCFLVSLDSGGRVLSHFEMLLKMNVSDEYQRKQIMARAFRVLWEMCEMANYECHGNFIMLKFWCDSQHKLEDESILFVSKLQNAFNALCEAFLIETHSKPRRPPIPPKPKTLRPYF